MSRDLVEDHIQNINEIEAASGYIFKEKKNLLLALTHSSYANERKAECLNSNERLEFLGDAVLNVVTSEYIYRNHPSLPEGDMTKTRAAIVCEGSLVKCAVKLMLGKHILLGRGEENTGGRSRISILSDAFEALIGAIYLDGGISEAAAFIHRSVLKVFNDTGSCEIFIDYKTQLQEIIQKSGDQKVSYRIADEKGPDHNKQFIAEILVGGRVLGSGEGKNKKEAEQNAARKALGKLQEK